MKIHHTKNKGDLGVLKSQADLYYFDSRDWENGTTLALRVETPRNNQKVNIKFANDYREVP